MKIQLNYDTKVITVEKRVNLKLIFKTLKRILSDWEEWELNTNTEIIWRNPSPIIISTTPQVHPYPHLIEDSPTIHYEGTHDTDSTPLTTPGTGVYQLNVSWE